MPKPQLTQLEDRSVPAIISGTVYADSNSSGVLDTTELGIAGATVTLDPLTVGTFADQVVTDAAGNYTFNNVAGGTHQIRFEPQTEGEPNDAAQRLFTIDVPQSGDTIAGPNFAVLSGTAIKGIVFADLNSNGKREPGEMGVANVPVTVDLGGTGFADYTVTSAADGSFTVSNVPDGEAVISTIPPASYLPTGLTSVNYTISAANPSGPLELGLSPATGISGRVTNTLGLGIGGVGVALDSVGGLAGQTTTTDPDGNYLFVNVQAGPHTITFTPQPGALFATADGRGVLTPIVGVNGGRPLAINQDITLQYAGSVAGSLTYANDPTGSLGGVLPTLQLDAFNLGRPLDVTPTLVMNPVPALPGTSATFFRLDGIPNGTHTLIITPPVGAAPTTPLLVPITIVNGGSVTLPAIPLIPTGITPVPPTVPPTTPPVVPPPTPVPPVTPPVTPLPPLVNSKQVLIGSGANGTIRNYGFTANADGTLTPVAGPVTDVPAATGGVRVVMADFNGDGVADTITGSGPGGPAMVRVYDGKAGALLTEFMAYEAQYTGGLNIAAADFNRDGKADIVVGADLGGGPRVRVFNSSQFQSSADPGQSKLIADFFAIEDPRFRGGVRVAAGDVSGDGTPDLVVGAGQGGGPRIAIYDGRTVKSGQTPIKVGADFFAFEPTLRSGTNVAVGDVNGDGFADIVAGAGAGGAPRVVTFSGIDLARGRGAASRRVADFYVNGDTQSRSGTTVAARDLDGDGRADVIASGGGTAYVVTSKAIVNQYLAPQAGGPRSDAVLDGFLDGSAINLG